MRGKIHLIGGRRSRMRTYVRHRKSRDMMSGSRYLGGRRSARRRCVHSWNRCATCVKIDVECLNKLIDRIWKCSVRCIKQRPSQPQTTRIPNFGLTFQTFRFSRRRQKFLYFSRHPQTAGALWNKASPIVCPVTESLFSRFRKVSMNSGIRKIRGCTFNKKHTKSASYPGSISTTSSLSHSRKNLTPIH